jgi:hypothetical protein
MTTINVGGAAACYLAGVVSQHMLWLALSAAATCVFEVEAAYTFRYMYVWTLCELSRMVYQMVAMSWSAGGACSQHARSNSCLCLGWQPLL